MTSLQFETEESQKENMPAEGNAMQMKTAPSIMKGQNALR